MAWRHATCDAKDGRKGDQPPRRGRQPLCGDDERKRRNLGAVKWMFAARGVLFAAWVRLLRALVAPLLTADEWAPPACEGRPRLRKAAPPGPVDVERRLRRTVGTFLNDGAIRTADPRKTDDQLR
jgi:hypothetical protein